MTVYANPTSDQIRDILMESKTIAVVGISNREGRASRYVSEYMLREGYTIYPVNPLIDEWHGLRSYERVADIPGKVDIVDVFRRQHFTLAVAEDAVAAGAKVLWLQQGIVNHQAADVASSGGLSVVMDACLMVEHRSMKLGL
ncbi:MAG: CoA-binding protein [Chloroflexi bacterium]|nr:CoA-binding protein [Chloroflexota bacterium]